MISSGASSRTLSYRCVSSRARDSPASSSPQSQITMGGRPRSCRRRSSSWATGRGPAARPGRAPAAAATPSAARTEPPLPWPPETPIRRLAAPPYTHLGTSVCGGGDGGAGGHAPHRTTCMGLSIDSPAFRRGIPPPGPGRPSWRCLQRPASRPLRPSAPGGTG